MDVMERLVAASEPHELDRARFQRKLFGETRVDQLLRQISIDDPRIRSYFENANMLTDTIQADRADEDYQRAYRDGFITHLKGIFADYTDAEIVEIADVLLSDAEQ